MRVFAAYLLGVVFGLASASAHALSAEEMTSHCRPITKAELDAKGARFVTSFSTGICWGAFQGVQQAIRFVDADKNTFFAICAPPKSTLTQLILIYVTYTDKNPARLHEDWFDVALLALRDAFPCPKK